MEVDEKKRLSYLDAMGIQAWRLRLRPFGIGAGDCDASALSPSVIDAVELSSEVLPPPNLDTVELAIAVGRNKPAPAGVSGKLTGQMPETVATRPYSGLCMTLNSTALPEAGEYNPAAESASHKLKNRSPIANCNWDELQALVASCTNCALHQARTQTVFGVGNRTAHWMVIGEAPGEQEDLQGEPFVGRAGLLLNEMLRAIGLERGQVFIANILKCRPPKNRDPQIEEAASCEGYLKRQVGLVKPAIILAVGRIAAQNLLKTTTPIGKLRGIVHDYQGVPLVVTYHPAYLLRSPLEKRRAFDDLRLALHTYRKTL